MNNRSILLITALLVIILTVTGTVFANGGAEAVELPLPEGFSSAGDGGITMQWKLEGENLHVRMAAAVSGWVAVGFDPSRRMKDSDIIIGYVQDGRVFVEDHFGTGATSHRPDAELGGRNDVMNAEGREENGITWIAFTIPLDSGDQYDKVLQPGNSYQVNLAAGGQDDFGNYHGTKRTAVTMDL
jgi:hypothetical protein